MLSARGRGTGTCGAAQAHTRVHTPPRCAHTSTPRTCTESSVSRVLGAGVHTRTPQHVHPRMWGTAPALSPHWGGHTAVTLAGHMPSHTHGPRTVTHAHPQPATLCTHPECDGTETPPANCAHACTCTRVCGHAPILQWGGGSLAGLPPPHLLSSLPLCATGSGVCVTQSGVCVTQSGVCMTRSRVCLTRSRLCPGCGRGGHGAWLHSCAGGWSLGSRPRVRVWPRRAWERSQGGQQAGSRRGQGCCSLPGGHMSRGMA